MSACEECWDRAFSIARTTGRSQAEIYRELVTAFPGHLPNDDPGMTDQQLLDRITKMTQPPNNTSELDPIWRLITRHRAG